MHREHREAGWHRPQSSVVGTFNLFQEFPNLVVVEAWIPPGSCLDLVRRKGRGLRPRVEARAQNAVYDLFEGLAGLAPFRAQLG